MLPDRRLRDSMTARPTEATTEARRRIMRSIRSRDTEPELALRRALRSNGLFGYQVTPKELPGCPDVAFARQRLAIFVHGCFWHRCQSCRPHEPKRNAEFWRAKFLANVRRDDRRLRQLEGLGWEVMELWECEMRTSISSAVLRVIRRISELQDTSPERRRWKCRVH